MKLILRLKRLAVKNIKCFTTRPDTLLGFSFLALSADHPLSKHFEKDPEFQNGRTVSKTGTTEESIAQAEKIGFKTNLLAINPMDPKESTGIFYKLCVNGLVVLEQFLAVRP